MVIDCSIPITDLVAADHSKLSDEGDAVENGLVPPEDNDDMEKNNPIDNPAITSVLLIH